jgi:tetratricopeptide (TPR) repeat protein
VAYLASVCAVQVAGRYRLPSVAALFPLAGWAVAAAAGAVRAGRIPWREATPALAGFLIAGALCWPDWARVGGGGIVNHSFLLGLKRMEQGDAGGALEAFRAGARAIPGDPDCPLRIGQILLAAGDPQGARAAFRDSLEKFRGHDALLGLGECSLAEGLPDEAAAFAREALDVAPLNIRALDLASRAFRAAGDWEGMARACHAIASQEGTPASAGFSEAWAWLRAGRPADAVRAYRAVAESGTYAPAERCRAAFLAGATAWRADGEPGVTAPYWGAILRFPPNFFTPAAAMLAGKMTPAEYSAGLPPELGTATRQYADLALGLAAEMRGDRDEAARHFSAVAVARNAAALPPSEQTAPEILAAAAP